LVRTLEGLLEGFARICHLAAALGSSLQPVHNHTALVAAVSSGNSSEARSLAMAEIQTAEAIFIQTLLGSESLSTTNVDLTPTTRPHRFYLDIPKDADSEGSG